MSLRNLVADVVALVPYVKQWLVLLMPGEDCEQNLWLLEGLAAVVPHERISRLRKRRRSGGVEKWTCETAREEQ